MQSRHWAHEPHRTAPVPQDAGPRKLLAPTKAPAAPAGLAAIVSAAVLPVVNVDLTHGVTATAVAAATASAAIYAVLQVKPLAASACP